MNQVSKNVIIYLLLGVLIAFFIMFIFFLIYFTRNTNNEYLIVRSLKTAIVVRNALIKSLKFTPVAVIFLYVFSFSVLMPVNFPDTNYPSILTPIYEPSNYTTFFASPAAFISIFQAGNDCKSGEWGQSRCHSRWG